MGQYSNPEGRERIERLHRELFGNDDTRAGDHWPRA